MCSAQQQRPRRWATSGDAQKVGLQVLDQPIDTTSKAGRLMFSIIASMAQFETELRAERQTEGMQRAKQNGLKFARQPSLSPEQVAELKAKRASGLLIKDLMAEYSLSKPTV